jgi:type I restriction enzyme M protein
MELFPLEFNDDPAPAPSAGTRKPMARTKAPSTPQTTAQTLGSAIKSARDIMRKDKGLNGDLDRLPMLTWVMCLKFVDDLEQQAEDEAALAGQPFRPAISAPYRWRDWASEPTGITGDDLIAFVNNEQTVRPDGTQGPGLFAYLRGLRGANGGDRRDVIAAVFRGISNRMLNGYLLRDLINKVEAIHFTSSDEIHTLGNLYESMLREMRDAAGDSGEFYTPRPLVKLIVKALDPKIGETVMDPAAGTGGFLVEAFEHLRPQADTLEKRETLQRDSLMGFEPKPLPYLLCQMNLLLHGLEAPTIDNGNALRFKLSELGDAERVDVIATNPPFGGEEEAGLQNNFPDTMRTGETALLFLQLIMRRLRRPLGGKQGGRAGVVVPNGTLFAGGVAARIKEQLFREFNLHTVVRLPNGVFSPYTNIPTNVLFFERGGPTREVWYYEQPLPEGRKQYTKTAPLRFEEFAPLLAWWGNREENERAWRVPAESIAQNAHNLDLKNPSTQVDFEHMPPTQLVEDILAKERRIAELLGEIKAALMVPVGPENPMENPRVPLSAAIRHRKEFVEIDDVLAYKRCRVQLHAKGIVLRDEVLGREIKTKRQQVCRPGELLVAEIDAKHGGYGIVPDELAGAIVSSHYFLFDIDEERLDRQYLGYYIRTPAFRNQVAAQGSTNYAAIRPQYVLDYLIPLPPLPEQRRIVARVEALAAKVEEARGLRQQTAQEGASLWRSVLNASFQPTHCLALSGEQTGSVILNTQATRYAQPMSNRYNNAHPWTPCFSPHGPHEIPQNWTWTNLGSVLTHIVDCVNDTPDFVDAPTGFIGVKSSNVRPYSFDSTILWHVTEEDYQQWNRRETPKAEDILLTREAPMGYACLVPSGINIALTQRLVLLRSDPQFVDPKYVLHFLNSEIFLDQVVAASRGLTVAHIRVGDIPKFLFPLPPREEQARIVAFLDHVQSKTKALAQLSSEAELELDALLPAILDQAFQGEL